MGILDFFNRGADALAGQTPSYGGLLTPEDQRAAQSQARMALAAQLLEAGGPSPTKTSFGQALGRSMLSANQARQGSVEQSLQAALLRRQLQAMNQPKGPRRTVVGGRLVDEDTGQVIYESPQEGPKPTEAEQLYGAVERLKAQGVPDTDPRVAALNRQISMLGTRSPGVNVNIGDKLPAPMSGYGYVDDPTSPFGKRLVKIPGAPAEQPTEGERGAANYYGRMEAGEKLIGTYKPSFQDYAAAQTLMSGGPVSSSIANTALSQEGQQYYQAAADWVRAKLRKESGATIPPEEMIQEIRTYFPVPGDDDKTIEQKRRSRLQAMDGMKKMGGRAVSPLEEMQIFPSSGGNASKDDPLGILR